VIETRRQIEELSARKTVCERDIRALAEKGRYNEANRRQREVHSLEERVGALTEQLKALSASDERRREELHALRESARALRMEMKGAADRQEFVLAAEKQLLAEVVQAECDSLQAELKQMRRRESSKDGKDGSSEGGADEEGEEGEGGEEGDGAKSAIKHATVRVTPFDPFCISVGRNELQVTLIDTPGYGEYVDTERSFEAICCYVEEQFERHLAEESDFVSRAPETLEREDKLVHCVLYFIAPHRLKHIDLAFMRRLHRHVNIVPIIAKSDTMTTKEKEEFKLLVREELSAAGITLFPFDMDVVRQMEQLDKQEYKPPWAVIGSTDEYLEAGHKVYLRKYPWGSALSSEPGHSDLPALRNLIMWSGQWQELKLTTRAKYEEWRAHQSALGTAANHWLVRSCHAASARLAAAGGACAASFRAGCRALRVPPRVALAALLLLLLAAGGALAHAAVRARADAEASAGSRLELLRKQVKQMAADKARQSQGCDARTTALSEELGGLKAQTDEAAIARRQLTKENGELRSRTEALARELAEARRVQAKAESSLSAAKAEAAARRASRRMRERGTDTDDDDDGSRGGAGGGNGATNGCTTAGAEGIVPGECSTDGDAAAEWGQYASAWMKNASGSLGSKTKDASRKAMDGLEASIEAASEKLGPSLGATATKAKQAVNAVRVGVGAAAKQWLRDVQSTGISPAG